MARVARNTCGACHAYDRAIMVDHGYCRLRAPTIDPVSGDGEWPIVEKSDWCLDFVPPPPGSGSAHLIQQPENSK